MIFKKSAIPVPSQGLVITEVDQVVPDQSLSLREILTRFVRDESLPVGGKGQFGNGLDPEVDSPLNIDIEKAAHWDLTERDEFNQKVEEMKETFEKQERAKKKRAHDEEMARKKVEFEKAVETEVEKRSKKNPRIEGSI